LRVHVDHVREKFGKKPIGAKQMVRCARDLGLRARVKRPSLDQLNDLALPAIAALRDGGFLILGQISQDAALIQYATASQPERITRAQFECIWDGRLVLMTHPRTWTDLAKKLIAPMANAIRGFARSFLALAKRPPVSTRWVANLLDRLPERKVAEAADADQVKKQREAIVPPADDAGLAAFVMMLRVHGIGADAEQIRHHCASATIGVNEMLRCAKQLGLKARVSSTSWDRLSVTPTPAIAALRDGSFVIIGKVGEDKVLIQYPKSSRPEALSREEFEARWDGRLVLMTRRASLTELSRRFDFTWFVGAIYKYRRLLGEVLLASFFLQLFALV